MGSGPSAAHGSRASRATIDAMYDRYAAAAAAKGTAWPGIDAEAILAPSDSEVGTPAIPWHDRFLFIDTRTQSERNISQIPGSVTTSDFEDLLKRDPPGLGGKQPVAYCTIGYRSGNYCTRINSSATIPDTIKVLNLKGSVLAWIHAGGPLVDKTGLETTTVHVFGSQWDLAPEGYDTVRFPLL